MHGFCQVLDKPLGKSGEYSQNCLANFGEPGESQHFSCFGHFALGNLAKLAKLAKFTQKPLITILKSHGAKT